jgi:glycosyltransferase involved in cell wall biosynthesis
MKILLLGEFSGFHKNLKEGLVDLGHEVYLISSGDGWKEIPGSDNTLRKYSVANNVFKKIINLIYPFLFLSKFKNHDVVHIINPFIFSNHFLSELLIKYIKKNNRFFSMSACGFDPPYLESMREFNYAPFSLDKQLTFYSEKEKQRFNLIYQMIDLVIPVMYDNAKGYNESSKCSQIVPLPINLKNIKFIKNSFQEKIVIYHGIIRRGFKGSDFIIKALDKLKKSHGNLVEIIITEKIPYDDYKEILNKSNILIDQCKSQAYGMNAIIGLGMGKVVLSGSETEAMSYFKFNDECPIINITPVVDQIYEALKTLVENPIQIEKISKEGRLFVENYHSHIKIAEKYISLWNKTIQS